MEINENYMNEIIPISSFCSSFLITCFLCECLLPFLKRKTKIKIKIYHQNVFYKVIFFCCLVFHIYFIMCKKELDTYKQLYAVCFACFLVFLRQIYLSNHFFLRLLDCTKVELNLSLRESESIGAFWAHQTYDAYYKIILENIMDRMENFEKKHNIQFFTKKLLLVIPYSCNIEGTFTQKDSSIEEFGNLDIVENDAGGNMNRNFKNPVVKICSLQDVYIVAEFSQPVSTLKRSKYILKDEKFIYIRECFLRTLKSLLQGSPCILVLHDDVNCVETLSDCILSTIKKEKKTNFIV